MDIADLIYSDTAEMEIKGHDGLPMQDAEGNIMRISFFSEDTQERLRAYSRYRKALMEAGKDDDMILDAECGLLRDMTNRFHHVIYNGKEATLKDAFQVYRSISKIREASLLFVGDNGNFIKEHLTN